MVCTALSEAPIDTPSPTGRDTAAPVHASAEREPATASNVPYPLSRRERTLIEDVKHALDPRHPSHGSLMPFDVYRDLLLETDRPDQAAYLDRVRASMIDGCSTNYTYENAPAIDGMIDMWTERLGLVGHPSLEVTLGSFEQLVTIPTVVEMKVFGLGRQQQLWFPLSPLLADDRTVSPERIVMAERLFSGIFSNREPEQHQSISASLTLGVGPALAVLGEYATMEEAASVCRFASHLTDIGCSVSVTMDIFSAAFKLLATEERRPVREAITVVEDFLSAADSSGTALLDEACITFVIVLSKLRPATATTDSLDGLARGVLSLGHDETAIFAYQTAVSVMRVPECDECIEIAELLARFTDAGESGHHGIELFDRALNAVRPSSVGITELRSLFDDVERHVGVIAGRFDAGRAEVARYALEGIVRLVGLECSSIGEIQELMHSFVHRLVTDPDGAMAVARGAEDGLPSIVVPKVSDIIALIDPRPVVSRPASESTLGRGLKAAALLFGFMSGHERIETPPPPIGPPSLASSSMSWDRAGVLDSEHRTPASK